MRKKIRYGRNNTVSEDHRKCLEDWIKCMWLLNFKVPLFMVIHQLFYVSKGSGCLWLENFKYGVPSIKWAKDFVEDPQWGPTEAKMGPLDRTE